QAVETIQLLQLEVEELKEKNAESQRNIENLQTENEQLKNEHRNWQEHIRSLLGKFDNV
ncbi:TPA: cell division protein ZapB, partial [Haemophilus influenzae]